jgi:LuxR family maltose regulon positive regulatory protein
VSAPTFALTKIQPPRLRSALIARPALEHSLGDALASARLTLISAPAGYGKTAALTRQLGHLPEGTVAAWVALDEDDDLSRVAHCIVAALEPFDLPWRTSPDALIAAMQDGQRISRQAFVVALVNALAATDVSRGLLVLDDVHRITDPALFDAIDAMVERLPAHWGLVMASRTDPPLALARLRAQGDCVELRQDELGFSPDDVRSLMQLRHAGSSDELVRAMHERTQGWPAGLGLVLSDSGRHGAPRAGSLRDRHVFDYLASEVLDDLPDELRQFLLRCSVLPELTAERCAAVSGSERAAHWLEEIERRGLFASVLDSEVYTLRLHDLFRDCLDDRLRREGPGELPELLVRAAQSESDPVRRMGYLLRAGDWHAAERELSSLTPELLVRGEISLVLRLWGQFPAELRASSPQLQLSRCITAWAQWDWPSMREAALKAVDGFAALGDEPMRRRALSYVCIAYGGNDEDEQAQQHVDTLLALPLEQDTLCRTLLVASLFAQPRDLHRLAETWAGMVDALERMDSLQLWYECSPVPGYVGLPGTRQSMLRYVAGVQRRLPEQPIPLSGMTQVTQGWLHLWSARWSDVSDTLARAESDCRWLSQPNNLRWQLHVLSAMLLALQGDAAGACAAARVLIDMARTLSGQHTSYLARAVHYAQRIASIAGDEATLREMNEQLEAARHDPRWALPRGPRAAADAYIAVAEGRMADACAAWTQVLECEISVELYGQAVETRLRLASALAEAHRLDDAAQVLRPVLARLQDSAEFGMAATAGRHALEQLAGARWSTLLNEDEQALLHRWVAAAQALQSHLSTATASSALSTPSTTQLQITPREFEVLQRIAAGDSNKLIARAFDLSPHTVKRHVANILDKLGVATRGQAAAWARDHA